MAFTVAGFAGGLAALTITGVAEAHTEPPRVIARVPCSYPRLPDQDDSEIAAFNSTVGLRAASIELVILVNPILQNTQSANYSLTLDLIDALHTALAAAAATLQIDRWSIRGEWDTINSVPYWAIVATVDGSG